MFMLLGGEGTHPKKSLLFQIGVVVVFGCGVRLQHLLTIKPLLCWVVIMGGHRLRNVFRL